MQRVATVEILNCEMAERAVSVCDVWLARASGAESSRHSSAQVRRVYPRKSPRSVTHNNTATLERCAYFAIQVVGEGSDQN